MIDLPTLKQCTCGVVLFGSLELLYPRLHKNEKSGLLLLLLLSVFARMATTSALQPEDAIPLFVASGFSALKLTFIAGKFFFNFPRTMTPLKFLFCLIAFVTLTPFLFYVHLFRGGYFWFLIAMPAYLFQRYSGLDIPFDQIVGFWTFFLIPFSAIWTVLNYDIVMFSDDTSNQSSSSSRWTPPRDRALFADLIYRYDRFRGRI